MMASDPSPSLSTQLAAFRQVHPPRTRIIDGTAFQYYSAGPATQPDQPVAVILPGLLGRGEMSFQLATWLKRCHRVIAPSWPRAADSAEQLACAVAAILDGEGIVQAAVVGASFGGLLAQRFALRYPDRVTHLVLADTSVPRPDRAAANRRAARIIAVLPSRLVRWLLRQLSSRAMRGNDPSGFWAQYTAEVVAGLSADDLASRYRVAADLDAGPTLDGRAFAQRTLLLESDDDPIVRKEAARALREAFPGAALHVFHKGGHSPAIRYPEQYAKVLADFFARPAVL